MSDDTNQDTAAAPERTFPYTKKLAVPIELGKTTITELTFQRGNVGIIRGMDIDGVPNVDEVLLIASRLCGKPVPVLEKLDPEDSPEVIEIALTFFGRCLGT